MTTAFQSNAFQNDAFQIDEEEAQRPFLNGGGGWGGPGGLTHKEILRLGKRRKKIEEELTETLRPLAYGATPELEAKVAAAQAALLEAENEEAIVTLMLMHHYRKTLH
jgi:hypothetical protein